MYIYIFLLNFTSSDIFFKNTVFNNRFTDYKLQILSQDNRITL